MLVTALVQIALVVVAVALVRRSAEQLERGAAEAAAWAERVQRYTTLGELADGIAVPTRDLSSPADAAADLDRLQGAIARVSRPIDRARQDLRAAPATAATSHLAADLDAVSLAAKQLSEEIWTLYSYLRNGMQGEAAQRVVPVNAARAALRQSIDALVAAAREFQAESFAEQAQAAESAGPRSAALAIVALLLAASGLATVLAVRHQLADAARRVADADRGRASFLAGMSHALRAPMNGTLGMTELMLGTKITREQKEYLEAIKASSETLLTTLSNALDLAKLEAGRLDLESGAFDVRSAVYDTLRLVKHRADCKGIELLWQVDPEVPDLVLGDVRRLQQVLYTLLDNAVRFTDEGEVVVRCRCTQAAAPDVGLAFDVSDTGIGISEADRDRMFRDLLQSRAAASGGGGSGAGLDLLLAGHLVRMMGGAIDVQSAVGRGSTFRFDVKLRLPEEVVRRRTLDPVELRDRDVLVLDDNATSRRILVGQIRGFRGAPVDVGDVESALGALRTAARGGRAIGLAVVDLDLPGVGTADPLAWLRRAADVAPPRCIGLTTADDPRTLAYLRGSGLVRCLTKPIRGDEFLAALREAATAARAAGATEATERRRLRILLCDDTRVDQILVTRLLERAGHEVTPRSNGAEAIEALGEQSFDVVLMDVQMPVVDGLEATRRIREDERARPGRRPVPIIALTADDNKGRCLEVGMDWYCSKPVKLPDLLSAIERVVDPCAGAGEAGEADEDERGFPRAAAPGADTASTAAEVTDLVLGQSAEALEAMSRALVQRDLRAVQTVARLLRSSLEVLDAAPASVAAATLESVAGEGQLDRAVAALASLREEIASLASRRAPSAGRTRRVE